jgi:hypothetical protein
MSEFEDRLNSILNDPEQMDKIASMAKSLMGGGGSDPSPQPAPPSGDGGIGSLLEGLDPGMIQRAMQMMSGMNQGTNENTALLEAMKPFLKEKRRAKMDRAMKLAKMAKMAQLAFGDLGGIFRV